MSITTTHLSTRRFGPPLCAAGGGRETPWTLPTGCGGSASSEYEPAFRENEIDWEVLSELTTDDLKEIGVAAVGHRRRLLEAIAALGESVRCRDCDRAG